MPAVLILGQTADGEQVIITVDTAGHLQMDVLAVALPSGAATLAEQQTQTTALQLIDDLRNALGSVNTDDLQVDVKTSALPTGASTETTLAAVLAKLDVALSTRALEAGGNLAAILAKLDVALSTRALETGGNLAAIKTAVELIDDLRNALGSVNTDDLQVGIKTSALPTGASTETTLAAVLAKLDVALSTRAAEATLAELVAVTKTYQATYSDAALGAGATVNLLAATNGRGRVFHASLLLDGAANALFNSTLNFYIDGEASPSLSLSPAQVWDNHRLQTTTRDDPVLGVGIFDTTNDIYNFWIAPQIRFRTSIQVTITNGDAANPTFVRAGALYTLET